MGKKTLKEDVMTAVQTAAKPETLALDHHVECNLRSKSSRPACFTSSPRVLAGLARVDSIRGSSTEYKVRLMPMNRKVVYPAGITRASLDLRCKSMAFLHLDLFQSLLSSIQSFHIEDSLGRSRSRLMLVTFSGTLPDLGPCYLRSYRALQ